MGRPKKVFYSKGFIVSAVINLVVCLINMLYFWATENLELQQRLVCNISGADFSIRCWTYIPSLDVFSARASQYNLSN